jgi:hypothetical protein
MTTRSAIAKHWIPFAGVCACLTCLSPAVSAQTNTITYDLQDVWLDPYISHNWLEPQLMTGTFEWTYEDGDFENGTGVFTQLYIPWYGSDIDGLNITIETGGLETSLAGNWHDRGCDVNLKFMEPLTQLDPSSINLAISAFDIQYGVSYQGKPISGVIVPLRQGCPGDFNGDGAVNTLDVLAFLHVWSAGDQAADFNDDGEVNTLDVLAFLNAWSAGC